MPARRPPCPWRSRHPRRLPLVITWLVVATALGPCAALAAAAVALPATIPAAERDRLQPVVRAASVSTHYEATPFPARREVFEYLLDHPEFATHVTRALRFARYRIWQTRDGLFLDDGWGAKGRFEVVHAANGIRVMHARGKFEQRLLPDITGEAVVVIEYGPRAGADGKTDMATTITGFVKVDNAMLAAMTRATGFAAEKADREAERLARVFARTSGAIERNPAAVYEAVRQRPDVPRRELEEFRELLNLPRTSTP